MFLTVSLICAISLVGCNPPAAKDKPADASKKSEEEIKTAFATLQAAIKAKDADKIWSLLAKDSQDDTDREAKAVKEAFSKLAEKDKPEYEKKVGLSAKELTEMTGKLYVKSKSFFTGKADEIPDSKLDKVVVAGESGTVHYIEDDGDKEKLVVVREQGQWKFAVPVAKAVLK